MRSILELLIIVKDCILDNDHGLFTDYPDFWGLCELTGHMQAVGIISAKEEIVIDEYIWLHYRPRRMAKYSIYFWDAADWESRLEAINESIEREENEEK